MKDRIKKAHERLLAKRPKATAIAPEDFVSTGSVPLNLAFSGHPDRGVAKGLYYFFVGDSSTGKSWVARTILAEACYNPAFADYRLIHVMGERGAFMVVKRYFGKLADRLEPVYVERLEDFYDKATEFVEEGPCIVVCDSITSLISKAEEKEDKEDKQSYGVSAAKLNSRRIRVLCNRIARNGSILIVVGQTRQRIGFAAKFEPRTRSGGDALTFYSRIELWMSRKERVRKKVGLKKVQIGQVTKVKITKNHVCGWEGEVDVPIYKGIGVDYVGGMIDFLTEWGHWKKSGKDSVTAKIDAKEFGEKANRETLARFFEDSGQVNDLKKLVRQVWNKIEDETTVKRESRYR